MQILIIPHDFISSHLNSSLMHEIHRDEASAILAALKLESDRLHLADSLGPS